MTEALPSSYWISHNAIRITLNAMNKYDYIQCGATGGAVVMCYMKGIPGLEYDAGHNYRRWPLTVAPVFFNDHLRKYVYVAIPRNSEINPYAFLAFPSVRIDIYGKTEPEEGQEEGVQVGSEDYYYVWLQGIISASVSDGGEDQEREWEQYVDYGSLSTDEAFAEKEASWWRYNADDDTVTFLKTITDAIFNYVTVNTNLNVKGNAVFEKTVRLLQGMTVGNDFVSGLLGTGGTFRKEADGKTYIEADKLYIRMKAYFDTVEIREYNYTGGNRVASAAGAKCVRVVPYGTYSGTTLPDGTTSGTVVPLDNDGRYHYDEEVDGEIVERTTGVVAIDFYRCYFRASDGDDVVRNNFKIGDLVYCHVTSIDGQSDNPEQKGLNQKHYWRLCIGRNTEGSLTVDGEGWIDISNKATEIISNVSYVGYQSGSDIPSAQDSMIQLGNVNDQERQGAIIEYVTGANAPSYQIYQGINSYSLNNKNYVSLGYNSGTGHAYLNVYGDFRFGSRDNTGSYINYNQNNGELDIKAKITALSGSTFDEVFGTKSGNLLRNTSFTGDYLSEKVDYETAVDAGNIVYSDPLKYWTNSRASVDVYHTSASGYAVTLTNGGYIQQSIPVTVSGNKEGESLIVGEKYMLSFRAVGGGSSVALTWRCGGSTGTISISSTLTRYETSFECSNASQAFRLTSTNTSVVMEIMLSRGNISKDWQPHYKDPGVEEADYYAMRYLREAIDNASTQILGGLVLTNLIKVGNYNISTHQMSKETGGMNGNYSSDDDPFIWGGGSMSQASYAINKYTNYPSNPPSDSEIAQMAKFVVTHGGRAILNDLILRGYIHALGGSILGDMDVIGGGFNVKDGSNTVVKVNGNTSSVSETGNVTILDKNGLYVKRGSEGFRLTTNGFERLAGSQFVPFYATRYVRKVAIPYGTQTRGNDNTLQATDDYVIVQITNEEATQSSDTYVYLPNPSSVSNGKIVTFKLISRKVNVRSYNNDNIIVDVHGPHNGIDIEEFDSRQVVFYDGYWYWQ